MKTLFLICLTFVFAACDSPMNNRVHAPENAPQNVHTKMFEATGLKAETQWVTGPVGNVSVANSLLVILKDAGGNPAALPENYSLAFYATMPSMGHPLDDPGFFEPISPGIFLNSSIRYNMPGDWKNEVWILDENLNVKDKIEWLEFF